MATRIAVLEGYALPFGYGRRKKSKKRRSRAGKSRRRGFGLSAAKHLRTAGYARSVADEAASDALAKIRSGDCRGAYNDVLAAVDAKARYSAHVYAAGQAMDQELNRAVMRAQEGFREVCLLRRK